MDKKLDKLINFLDSVDEKFSTNAEIAEVLGVVLQALATLRENFDQKLSDMDSETMEKSQELSKDLEKLEKTCSDMMKSHSKEMDRMKVELMEMIGDVKDIIPSMPDLSTLEKRMGEVEKREIPTLDNGEQIIEKINEDEGEKKIKREKVEGLDEELTAIRNLPRGGGSRRVFQPYVDDLSASCDGANRTFYLSRAPLKAEATMVYGTDWPVILRPLIDFTIANKVLTLSASIVAPSAGSTLICTFYA